MEHDQRLEIRAGARLFEDIAAARAIADRHDLCRIGNAEFLRFGGQGVIGLAAAGEREGQIVVHGEHAGAQFIDRFRLGAIA